MDAREIKDQTKMIDVVRRYGIDVNRAGFCRCPFHDEKTASMKIYDKSFYCYGCGAGGDVFDFVMQIEHCGFAQAYSILGGTAQKRTGAALLAEYNREVKRRAKERRVHEAAEKLHNCQQAIETLRQVYPGLRLEVQAAALAWYYALQYEVAELEDKYFEAKEGPT